MQIVGCREVKLIVNTELGELIQFSNGGHGSFGIIVAKGDDTTLVGTLNDHHEGHPRVIALDNDEECLSYGADWCLEPVEGDEAYPYTHEPNRRSGLLVLKGDNWFLAIAASGVDSFGRFTMHWLNLNTYVMSTNTIRGAYFSKWNIWLNADERSVPLAKPLLEFNAKSTGQRAT
ncbi:hypothetical protein ACCT03_29585 [Rhizobium johnstonii]|uniref:hypothetical protein n=1 Tax=Rhizobium TaxID=379 RepID=UPI00102F49FC|nr:hypothetical protein [Rhizobium leguminosarum]TBF84600.1 hypothetical protein ELG86_21715 [Rhizobium leguminosarum]TBH04045.1 hypothetical protein ELG70_21485 [Rhizobium leguminosarum]TBH13472.1 hypothetical protein ELG68_21110 [Rhizobium leguminosarum]TBH38523.1 hypothetical protein ELG66_23050 [Rhizobium leguminosarum]TBH61242.1 hypothetical protein ELG65_23840 [Rhizobium leguminosarum]